MKHIITFSGGKDSLATLLTVKQNIEDFEVVFCDTGWESAETYQHIREVETTLDISIKRLKGEYNFRSLSIKKKRVASTKARFCTDFLKIRPMIDYILSHSEDLIIYQGIRKDESKSRQKMKAKDEYFVGYTENWKNSTYRKKEVLQYIENYTVDVERPIFNLSADQVFEVIRKSGIAPNPLYKLGFSRVGCFPCIMCRHSEVKNLANNFPERINLIRRLENDLGRTFFPPKYIPDWACSKRDPKSGKPIPSIDDVVKYLVNENQLSLFEAPSCQSIYAICE